MSSCSNEQLKEVGCHESAVPDTANLSECRESPVEAEEDEDEEEDVDFNPFLKETLSPEASSSLSSEVEVLDANGDGEGNNFESTDLSSSKPVSDAQKFTVGDTEHDEEETVMQTTVSHRGQLEKELKKAVPRRPKKRKSSSSSQKETEVAGEKETGSSSGTDVNDVTTRELGSTTPYKPTMDLDDDDAICKRTRARYSLASFTLDELETFLQETDDDDDLQNVDDEEEYRKFLAAVLQGGDGDGQPTQEIVAVDDEDEDNDADFEIELEEALESDLDEGTKNKTQMDECEGGGRRPETRQNRRRKASSQYRKNLSGQAKRPLRPLVPVMTNVSIAPFFTRDGKTLMPETTPKSQSSRAEDGYVNGFTPHQIGQLHCLIHEHVQLLIQVFSLCALDHSRQHIASQVQGLVLELLHKRDQVFTWKKAPYSDFCFRPPYICPSVVDKLPKVCPSQCTFGSSNTFDAQGVCSPSNNQTLASRRLNLQVGSFQDVEKSSWTPLISGPVISILDVAPLNLAGRYMDDVYTAIQEYRQRHVESSSDTHYEREPLFPLPNFPSIAEANCDAFTAVPPNANLVPPLPSQQPPKKTLAATIVESTKKQSVALVPKEIAKLAQRFFPLFNSALFPHKPPPVSVANRVLFTDSEDELLALGLMEYNTDWKAIQQRFLPCKDKHQIFVRQKNRCSSKAPENPIKAVRRMKTSPLTAEEIERIQEGLKVFKLDWMSVWQFIVPYRDPSLLPRQWRIAIGTQRSYKNDAAKKEKRRLYELKRRSRTAELANWQTVSGKEDCPAEYAGGENSGGDDYTDNADEAFVHEAFLADWRPDTYSHISSERPHFSLRENNLPSTLPSQEGAHIRQQPYEYGEAQPQIGNMHEFPSASKGSQHPLMPSYFTRDRHLVSKTIEPNHPVSGVSSNTPKSQIFSRPYRVRKTNSDRLVRLAPDLPPVNLPPSVRVIPQSAFRNYQSGSSTKVSTAGSGTGYAGKQIIAPQLQYVAKLGTIPLLKANGNKTNVLKDTGKHLGPEESEVAKDICNAEETGTDSDLHMHPLLFKAPEDGRLPYYPLNGSSSSSSSFSFFPGNRAPLNLSLFHNPHRANHGVDCFNKSLKSKESTLMSSGIDFHPLLQRTDNLSSDLGTGRSTALLSVNSEGNSAQLQHSFCAVQTGSRVNNGGACVTGIVPSSPNERANELDLEIYLSSTSRKEKATGNNDVTAHNPMRSAVTALNHGATVETQNAISTYCQQAENGSAASIELVSGAHKLVGPRNNICGYGMDDMGEQSHPEIVMEQEELSDSDEEIEEHVEFECEEMADSEGEESGCEEIAEVQNKEARTCTRENIVTDADSDDQQCDLRTNVHPQENVRTPRKADPPSSGHEKHASPNRSWLSLHSCTLGGSPSAKPKHEGGTTDEDGVAKSSAVSRPSRSYKKAEPSTKMVTEQKQAADMTEQLSLGSLAIQRLKKPRKRVCKTNPSLNVGLNVGSSQFDGTDKLD